MNNLLSCFLTA